MLCCRVQVLSKWDSFTIWSVGRDGKKFFNSLSVENQNKVAAFCDIDPKKIGTKHTTRYDAHGERRREESPLRCVPFTPVFCACVRRQMKADNVKPIPIIHYTQAKAPIITCVALDRTEGKVVLDHATTFRLPPEYFGAHWNSACSCVATTQFERNLAELQLREGIDFLYFV